MTAAVQVPQMVHNPQPIRARDGHYRWSAICPCSWTAQGRSKEDAEKRCAEHAAVMVAASVAADMVCCCYDAPSMEYDPAGPCRKCQLDEAVAAAA